MRRSGLVGAAVLLVLSTSGCWLQPRVDAGNTNFVRSDPELTAATVGGLVELWSTDLTTSELVVGEVMAPVAINEDVYVAGVSFDQPIDAMAAALDLDTGTVRWSTPLDVQASPFRADLYDPAWVGGDVLVPYVEADPAITGGGTFSIDAATGTPAAFPLAGGGHLAVAGDRVASQTITVIRQPPPAVITTVNWGPFDPVWGSTSAPVTSDYAVVGDRIAWTNDSTGATGYSEDCGGGSPSACLPDWTTVLGGGRVSSPTALGDDRVVYTDTSGTVSVLDVATGAVEWEADLGVQGVSTQATVTPDLILVGSDRRVVVLPAAGCGAATCTPLWTGTTDQTVTSVVVAGDVAYAATSDGTIAAFDATGCGAATCDPLVEVSIGSGRFVTGGPIVHDGRVLAGTADGRVVAFGLPG